jgi:hypothetical protein
VRANMLEMAAKMLPTRTKITDFRKIAHIFYFADSKTSSTSSDNDKYPEISFYLHGKRSSL